MFVTIQVFSKSSFSLSSIGQDSKQIFLSFSLKFLQGFLTSKANKTFLPFLFHLFSCLMYFFSTFWENFEPKQNWGFCWFQSFLSKLIIGFLLWDVIKLFLGVYFDQFVELGKTEFSRAWNYPNWGFYSIEHNLMKLALIWSL